MKISFSGKKFWYWLAVLAFMVCIFSPAQAQVRRMNVEEIIQSSGTIIVGRITDVREGKHPKYSNVDVTFVTVEVSDRIKGDNSKTHTFMQFGGTGMLTPGDLPQYNKGEEVMLFLYPESSEGFSTPVGLTQGKFEIITDQITGKKSMVNGFGNKFLFEKMESTEAMRKRKGQIAFQKAGPIEYGKFVSLIKELAK